MYVASLLLQVSLKQIEWSPAPSPFLVSFQQREPETNNTRGMVTLSRGRWECL